MSYKNENEIDMDNFVALLSDAMDKVKTQEDVDVLNKLKKVYKQNVPFSLRMYVAAYLAKEAMQRGARYSHSRYDRRDTRSHYGYEERGRYDERHIRGDRFRKDTHTSIFGEGDERPTHERVQIPAELATTIFISIGRNRRVFPRDLIGLLINAGGLERERIGDIRVLASYSFVQLYKEDADAVIAKINGYDYRGRKLVVSYSQKKDISDEVENDAMSEEDAAAYAAAEKAAQDKEPFSSPTQN